MRFACAAVFAIGSLLAGMGCQGSGDVARNEAMGPEVLPGSTDSVDDSDRALFEFKRDNGQYVVAFETFVSTVDSSTVSFVARADGVESEALVFGTSKFERAGYGETIEVAALTLHRPSDCRYDIRGYEVTGGGMLIASDIIPASHQEIEFKASKEVAGSCQAEFEWDFGDGSPLGHGEVAKHRYASPGEYDVVVNAWCSGCPAKRTSANVNVTVFKYEFVEPARIDSISPAQIVYPSLKGDSPELSIQTRLLACTSEDCSQEASGEVRARIDERTRIRFVATGDRASSIPNGTSVTWEPFGESPPVRQGSDVGCSPEGASEVER